MRVLSDALRSETPQPILQLCLFIGRIDEDRSIEGCEGLDQCFRESSPWDVPTLREEFPMLQHSVAIDRVQGSWKGNRLVGPCAFVEGDRRHHRFEIQIAGRRPATAEKTCKIRCHVGVSVVP